MKSILVLFLALCLSSFGFAQEEAMPAEQTPVEVTPDVLDERESAAEYFSCTSLFASNLVIGDAELEDGTFVSFAGFVDADGNITEGYQIGYDVNVELEPLDSASIIANLEEVIAQGDLDAAETAELNALISIFNTTFVDNFTVKGQPDSIYSEFRYVANALMLFPDLFITDGVLDQTQLPELYALLESFGFDKTTGDFDAVSIAITDEEGNPMNLEIYPFETEFMCEGILNVTPAAEEVEAEVLP